MLDNRLSAVVLGPIKSLYAERKAGETDLAILRESIEADGLMLPLTVHPTEQWYKVLGDVRRLDVFKELSEADWPVPVEDILKPCPPRHWNCQSTHPIRSLFVAKLFQFGKKKPCYICGSPGPSTKEHVPPKSITPGIDCDRITVPSCDIHNSTKSGNDQAIANALVQAIDQTVKFKVRKRLSPELKAAIDSMSINYHYSKKSINMMPFASDLPQDLRFDLPYLRGLVNISDWITNLTAALVWSITGTHHNGSDWDRIWTWSPSYYPANVMMNEGLVINRIREKKYLFKEFEASGQWRMGWESGLRPYPSELYSFRVCIEPLYRNQIFVVFRHSFFTSFVFYSRVLTSMMVAEKINEFANVFVEPVKAVEFWVK